MTVLKLEEFKEKVLNSNVPVLVDFFATWCGPCKIVGPVLEDVAEEVGDSAFVCKVDVDESPELASEYGVMSVPTLVVFKDGKEVNRAAGVRLKNDLLEMLK